MPWYEPTLLLMAVLFTGLAVGLSRRVDLNEFSLHALYRNRLVRCYLGASNPKRAAHPFTGFDPRDDLPLAFDTFADAPTPIRPYPIFNVAMNLVGGKNLAWQQRKAASFILSPEYCGFEYRVDEDNEQERKEGAAAAAAAGPLPATGPGKGNGHGASRPVMRSAYALTRDHSGDARSITLGLAVATSGAAASPNMGYHTSPTLAFLMTVFNVRLGWWLRNPRWSHYWADDGSRLSLSELMSELLGMTTDDRAWVYLSDGGHFENLGVYELVRRKCRFIIACDAGQDGGVTFDDLGNAIEKCRADFGVDIEIDLERLRPKGDSRFSAAHCAIGTIRYDQQHPDDPPGTLLYLKSTADRRRTGRRPALRVRESRLSPSEHCRSVLRRVAVRELPRARLPHRVHDADGGGREGRDVQYGGGRALHPLAPAVDGVGADAAGRHPQVLCGALRHLDDGADDGGIDLHRRADVPAVDQLHRPR